MKRTQNYGKMLTVSSGWLWCPVCHRNKRVMRIRPDTNGTRVPAYCRDCKAELLLDIIEGECFESRGR